jgi:hypothetical protein
MASGSAGIAEKAPQLWYYHNVTVKIIVDFSYGPVFPGDLN